MESDNVDFDPWHSLRKITTARIALGRTGGSLPTREVLDFRLAHARARDAVLSPFDAAALAEELRAFGVEALVVQSAVGNRAEYLQRPDLGRRLAHASRTLLEERARSQPPVDLAIIVSDGLSTLAASTQAAPVVGALLPLFEKDGDWALSPIVIARDARVALQDEVGEIFRAKISLILLGERPGLGSADSLGAYFTFGPAIGRADSERNCVSNIRPGGLSPKEAGRKLYNLISESRRLGLSGVALKDDYFTLPPSDTSSGFL